jgi:hypothetical protein
MRLTRVVCREKCCGEQDSSLSRAEGLGGVVTSGFVPNQAALFPACPSA